MAEDNPLPEERLWTFRDRSKNGGPARTYTQSELTIVGEVQLFKLLNNTIADLNEAEFPWADVSEALAAAEQDGIAGLDWGRISNLITIALSLVPNLASEAAAIMFGIFPTDIHGQPNRQFDEDVAFILQDLNIARFIEMLKVFADQNEYKRLSIPFVSALRRELMTAEETTSSQSGEGTPQTSMSSSARGMARRARSRVRSHGETSTSPSTP